MNRIGLLVVLLLLSLLPNLALAETDVKPDFADGIDQNFVCSAYYSPLPGQSRYATGTYAGDIRLNGGGVRGASGKPVFPGMVAAPKEFAFGTKMYIPGIGMTEVADRGGAIKGNRLDIWFGYGDEALVNALKFGKRPCLVTVYGLNDTLLTQVNIVGGEVKYANLAENPFEFKDELKYGDNGEAVARLQQFLRDLGYFKGSVTANYDDQTKLAVEQFQKFNEQINKSADINSGVFGVVTIAAFEKVIIGNRERLTLKVPDRHFGRGATGSDVELLQRALKQLGYDVEIDGIYDQDLEAQVLKFQLAEGVISSVSDAGAGYFGPKTQARLDKLLLAFDQGSTAILASELKSSLIEEKVIEIKPLILNDDEMLGLKLNSRGDAVKKLQYILKERGYMKIEPTGYFGPLTANALFRFKKDLGLVKRLTDAGSRVVDRKFLDALTIEPQLLSQSGTDAGVMIKSTLDGKNSLKLNDYLPELTRTLELGVRGADVKALQEFLKNAGYFTGLYTTDYFGASTKAALIRWQLAGAKISGLNDANAGRLQPGTF